MYDFNIIQMDNICNVTVQHLLYMCGRILNQICIYNLFEWIIPNMI
jgi:hypothetical protein